MFIIDVAIAVWQTNSEKKEIWISQIIIIFYHDCMQDDLKSVHAILLGCADTT